MTAWHVRRIDAEGARTRLVTAARRHGFDPPTSAPRLVWIGIRADRLLADVARPGDRAQMPVPTSLIGQRTVVSGEVRRAPDAERYAPYWVFDDGDDAVVVDAVDGRLAGSVAMPAARAARRLVGMTLALLVAIILGLEIVEALLAIGVLLPLSAIFAAHPSQTASLAVLLGCFGGLYWYGRRCLALSRPLIEEAAAPITSGRLDLGRLHARPTVVWLVGALCLYVALRYGMHIVTGELRGWSIGVAVVTIGLAIGIFRLTQRQGRRPRETSPWVGVRSGAGAPIIVQWAHLTVRVAIFGSAAWLLSRYLGGSEIVHRVGLWVLDIGPGVEDHCVAAGVALGMWTHTRRWKRAAPAVAPDVPAPVAEVPPEPRKPAVAVAVPAPTPPTPDDGGVLLGTLDRARGAEDAPPPQPTRAWTPAADGLLTPLSIQRGAHEGSAPTSEPPSPAASPAPAPTGTPAPESPAPTPQIHVPHRPAPTPRTGRLPIKPLLATVLGHQVGALFGSGLAVVGGALGLGGSLALDRAQRARTPEERVAIIAGVIAAGALGRVIGQICGAFIAGALGIEAGAEIGEWTATSAALALAFADAGPASSPSSGADRPAPDNARTRRSPAGS